MSAVFLIYLFIFSIGTCFRFECHEDTFGTALLLWVSSSAHICRESWRIFKRHQQTALCSMHTFLFLSGLCLERLGAPLKLNEIRIMCKRGLYEIYKPKILQHWLVTSKKKKIYTFLIVIKSGYRLCKINFLQHFEKCLSWKCFICYSFKII